MREKRERLRGIKGRKRENKKRERVVGCVS